MPMFCYLHEACVDKHNTACDLLTASVARYPRCQIVTVPTILEILHDGTTVDYYTNGASFRYTGVASTILPASHCLLLLCKQTHTATTATELHSW